MYRVNLTTLEVVDEPIPWDFRNITPDKLLDLSWLPDEFADYRIYGWWPGYDGTRELGMFERKVGEPSFVANSDTKRVALIYTIEPWTDAEIITYKEEKYQATIKPLSDMLAERATRVARDLGFFGDSPVQVALALRNSIDPMTAACAEAVAIWVAQVRPLYLAALVQVQQTGLDPDPFTLYQSLPPVPVVTLPEPQEPEVPENPEPETPSE